AQRLLRSVRRSTDLVARVGGEEFAVLLPETSLDRAASIAESIRAAVADPVLAHPRSTVASGVTVSIGVACTVAQGTAGAAAFVERADGALYAAKRAGRNRVSLDPQALREPRP